MLMTQTGKRRVQALIPCQVAEYLGCAASRWAGPRAALALEVFAGLLAREPEPPSEIWQTLAAAAPTRWSADDIHGQWQAALLRAGEAGVVTPRAAREAMRWLRRSELAAWSAAYRAMRERQAVT